jgi:F-type H+-transporting ATPase subunit delta
MRISKQARRDAKALFQSCRVDGLLDEARVRQAVGQVVARRPRGYFALLNYFVRLVRLDLTRRAVRIESAVPLATDLDTALRASLARRYGSGLSVVSGTDAGLIGGVRVRIGSDVFDGSIQGRLAELGKGFRS